LRRISEDLECGELPGLCIFCGTKLEQDWAASVMASVRWSAVCFCYIWLVGILVGIFGLDCTWLNNLF